MPKLKLSLNAIIQGCHTCVRDPKNNYLCRDCVFFQRKKNNLWL